MKITRERKRLWWAIAGSLLVHLLVAFSLAAFARNSTPLPEPDEAPVQLTMVDLSATPPPAVRANPAYIETDPAKESKEEPKEKTFESNANSIAKSSAPASGDLPIPSQEGKERPFLQMQTQSSSLPTEASQPQPEPQPSVAPPKETPPPKPSATPKPTPKPKATPRPKATPLPEPSLTPAQDQLAMLTATPPPPLDLDDAVPTPPPEVGPVDPVVSRPQPPQPPAAYRPEKTQTRITGGISDRGPSSVNAVGTPLGKYQKKVSDAIGKLWYRFTKERMDMTSIGTAVLEAEVDASGKVRNLRVVSNSANESFANICLQSFQEAQIPPIPADLVEALPGGRLQVTFSFTMYAN